MYIIPFSISYSDTITNGIALCPNIHRAFDKVLISNSFKEKNTERAIHQYDGKPIILPSKERYFPGQENLQWHRAKVFK